MSCARGQSAAPGSPSYLREDLWLPSEVARPPNAPLRTVPFHVVPNPCSLFVIEACYFRAVDQAYCCWLFYIKLGSIPMVLTVVRSEPLPKTDVTQHPYDCTLSPSKENSKNKCFVLP